MDDCEMIYCDSTIKRQFLLLIQVQNRNTSLPSKQTAISNWLLIMWAVEKGRGGSKCHLEASWSSIVRIL